MLINKIHINNATTLSLNERFSILQSVGPQVSIQRPQPISSSPAELLNKPVVELLALQANVRAALTAKRLSAVQWPTLSATQFPYLELGSEVAISQSPNAAAMELWDQIYAELERPHVQTAQGLVRGTHHLEGGYSSFTGMRYAQAPTGRNRFGLILTTVLGVCSAGVLNKAYLPPNSQSAAGAYRGAQGPTFSGGPRSTFSGGPRGSVSSGGPAHSGGSDGGQVYSPAPTYSQGSSRAQAGSESHAAILKQDSDITPEGYHSSYETENGIKAEESAQALNGVQARGGFSYTGDDGQQYSISYTADENGFQAQGAHIPTSPPIPEEILKALEQNARDEAAGIIDDGSYSEGKYGGPEGQNSGPSQQYGAPQRAQGQFNAQTGYHY